MFDQCVLRNIDGFPKFFLLIYFIIFDSLSYQSKVNIFEKYFVIFMKFIICVQNKNRAYKYLLNTKDIAIKNS